MFNYVFPTCIWAERQKDLADSILPVAEEYLQKYGESFRGDSGYITTYYNNECSSLILKDDRFQPLIKYLVETAIKFLENEQVDSTFFKDSINNTKFLFINKTQRGGSHPIHAHPKSLLSGCFYLKTTQDSSPIIFQDPRDYYKYNYYPLKRSADKNIYASSFTTEVVVPAVAGDILMWPSWLEHQVVTSTSNDDRIGIAYNLGMP